MNDAIGAWYRLFDNLALEGEGNGPILVNPFYRGSVADYANTIGHEAAHRPPLALGHPHYGGATRITRQSEGASRSAELFYITDMQADSSSQQADDKRVEYGDLPISTPAQDLFGIDTFAQSLATSIRKMASPEGVVIALNGVWGSGKSSAVNLINHHLADAVSAGELELR